MSVRNVKAYGRGEITDSNDRLPRESGDVTAAESQPGIPEDPRASSTAWAHELWVSIVDSLCTRGRVESCSRGFRMSKEM